MSTQEAALLANPRRRGDEFLYCREKCLLAFGLSLVVRLFERPVPEIGVGIVVGQGCADLGFAIVADVEDEAIVAVGCCRQVDGADGSVLLEPDGQIGIESAEQGDRACRRFVHRQYREYPLIPRDAILPLDGSLGYCWVAPDATYSAPRGVA